MNRRKWIIGIVAFIFVSAGIYAFANTGGEEENPNPNDPQNGEVENNGSNNDPNGTGDGQNQPTDPDNGNGAENPDPNGNANNPGGAAGGNQGAGGWVLVPGEEEYEDLEAWLTLGWDPLTIAALRFSAKRSEGYPDNEYGRLYINKTVDGILSDKDEFKFTLTGKDTENNDVGLIEIIINPVLGIGEFVITKDGKIVATDSFTLEGGMPLRYGTYTIVEEDFNDFFKFSAMSLREGTGIALSEHDIRENSLEFAISVVNPAVQSAYVDVENAGTDITVEKESVNADGNVQDTILITEGINYEIKVTNINKDPLIPLKNLHITDTLGLGLLFDAEKGIVVIIDNDIDNPIVLTKNDYTYNSETNKLVISIDHMIEDNAVIKYHAKFTEPAKQNDVIANNVVVTSDNVAQEREAGTTVTVEENTTVTIDKTNDVTGKVHPGDSITYTVITKNTGDKEAHGVNIVDTLGDYITYSSGIKVEICNITGDNCTLFTPNIANGEKISTSGKVIEVVVANLGVGKAVKVTYVAKVDEAAEGLLLQGKSVSNHVEVTIENGTGDEDDTTNEIEEDTTVTIDKTNDVTGKVYPGDSITYTVITKNTGAKEARGVKVVDTLGDYITYSSGIKVEICNITGETLSNCTLFIPNIANGEKITASGKAVEVIVSNLGVGKAVKVTYVAKVDEAIEGVLLQGKSVSNHVEVTIENGTGDEDDTTDVIEEDTTIDVRKTNLGTGLPASNYKVAPGSTIPYTVLATNTGIADAHGVRIVDTLDPLLAYDGTEKQIEVKICESDPFNSPGCITFIPNKELGEEITVDGQNIIVVINTLKSGFTAMVTYNVRVDDDNAKQNDIVKNHVVVTFENGSGDEDETKNTVEEDTTLEVKKTNKGFGNIKENFIVKSGQTIPYTVTVKNIGGETGEKEAHNVIIEDKLHEKLTYKEGSLKVQICYQDTNNMLINCKDFEPQTSKGEKALANNHDILVVIDTLKPGQIAVVTYDAIVGNAEQYAEVNNDVTVTASNISGKKKRRTVNTVEVDTSLDVTKTSDKGVSYVKRDEVITYTATVTNSTNVNAHDLVITDTLSGDIKYYNNASNLKIENCTTTEPKTCNDITASLWTSNKITVNSANTEMTIKIGTLESGHSVVLTYKAKVGTNATDKEVVGNKVIANFTNKEVDPTEPTTENEVFVTGTVTVNKNLIEPAWTEEKIGTAEVIFSKNAVIIENDNGKNPAPWIAKDKSDGSDLVYNLIDDVTYGDGTTAKVNFGKLIIHRNGDKYWVEYVPYTDTLTGITTYIKGNIAVAMDPTGSPTCPTNLSDYISDKGAMFTISGRNTTVVSEQKTIGNNGTNNMCYRVESQQIVTSYEEPELYYKPYTTDDTFYVMLSGTTSRGEQYSEIKAFKQGNPAVFSDVPLSDSNGYNYKEVNVIKDINGNPVLKDGKYQPVDITDYESFGYVPYDWSGKIYLTNTKNSSEITITNKRYDEDDTDLEGGGF